jgi:hypothetical protein
MRSRGWLDCLVLAALVAASRFAFRSRYLYDLDSVNFALALERFDPQVHQPHPPGYFLYVCLGRLAQLILPDANQALVAVSILASCGTACLLYALADSWFGRRAARWAGLLFLFSPLAWFHGTVALIYMVEMFFSAWIGFLCWKASSGQTRYVALSAAALGLAAGFRQSGLLFLAPLWLWSVRKAGPRRIALGCGILAVTILAWAVPMALSGDGVGSYFGSLYALWSQAPARQNAVGGFFQMAAARLPIIAVIIALCLGAASFLLVRWHDAEPDPATKAFVRVWMLPALAFFALVFLKFVNSGYLLVIAPPLLILMAARAAAWCTTARRKVAAIALAGVNVGIFLYVPLYCSYRSVRRFEAELENVIQGVRAVARPENTIIVGYDSHFLGYRHAGYYLPEYLTAQYPEAPTAQGRRIFAMRRRDTVLLRRPPGEGFREFVLFPLPGGDRYYEYEKGVASRFPPGALRTETAHRRRFLLGSLETLPLLFPSAAPQYTSSYSSR